MTFRLNDLNFSLENHVLLCNGMPVCFLSPTEENRLSCCTTTEKQRLFVLQTLREVTRMELFPKSVRLMQQNIVQELA